MWREEYRAREGCHKHICAIFMPPWVKGVVGGIGGTPAISAGIPYPSDGGIGKAEQNRAGLPDEEVAALVPGERVANFLGLTVFKRGHSPATPEGFLRTIACIARWFRTNETPHRPLPACTF